MPSDFLCESIRQLSVKVKLLIINQCFLFIRELKWRYYFTDTEAYANTT